VAVVSILRRIARRMGFVHREEMAREKRSFAAGNISRLTSDWVFYPTTADYDIRAGLGVIRARARELTQNDPYAKAFVLACRKNIVGAVGFQLQVKAKDYSAGPDGKIVGKLDRFANALIEQAFADWSRKGVCEVSGRFSFRKVQALCVTGVKRDGEMFVRMLKGKDLNKYGFALQLIEPDLIDERYNEILQSGNVIRMGIELTPQRKPIAYYVRRYQPNLGWNQVQVSGGPYDRIPASEMIHLYDPDRVDATRDVSQMAPSMLRLKMLAGYEEAAVINARVSACKMGFFRDPTGEAGEYEGDGKDAQGNKISSAEPGQMEDIGRLEFQPYDPKYPDSQHEPFVKSNLHGVAAGLGVSYANLSTDLSDTSYASSRTGLIEEREEWKEGQVWLAENLLDPVFANWLEMGLTMGAIGKLPLAKFDKFNAPKWSGRRWPWVDPLKDAEAMRASVGAGFKSPQQVISEAGGDMEDIYEEIAEAKKLADEYGLTFDYASSGKGTQKDTSEDSTDTGMPPAGGKPNGKGTAKDVNANA
jgi:lambda family phage portal protein